MNPNLVNWFKQHKTETVVIGAVGTIYVSTIVAASVIAGQSGAKAALKAIKASPLRVNTNPQAVARELAPYLITAVLPQ
jgi:hypothetical protein